MPMRIRSSRKAELHAQPQVCHWEMAAGADAGVGFVHKKADAESVGWLFHAPRRAAVLKPA